jgi:hypothetical protein
MRILCDGVHFQVNTSLAVCEIDIYDGDHDPATNLAALRKAPTEAVGVGGIPPPPPPLSLFFFFFSCSKILNSCGTS